VAPRHQLALICDVFPPSRSSGAVQLRDLAQQLAADGHDVTVITAASDLDVPWRIEHVGGVEVVRLKTPRTRDTHYVRRTLAELAMPFAMRRNLARSPVASRCFDGLIWYSPTIFLGPLVRHLKARSQCPSYLILRDVFPEWAVDLGLMGRGLSYHVFKAIADYQYHSANVIGVQTAGNLSYFDGRLPSWRGRIEVLENWLAEPAVSHCDLSINETDLSGRRIFVYAGNMGVAQQMDKLLNLAKVMSPRSDVGFLFLGRGSEVGRMKARCATESIENVLFLDEIEPDEVMSLLSQCHCGLVSLDSRHRSHNIPGKFLAYLQAGLPVLAAINPGNDLEKLVSTWRVGRVSTEASGLDLPDLLESMLGDELADPAISRRCRALWETKFSAQAAASQIVKALTDDQ